MVMSLLSSLHTSLLAMLSASCLPKSYRQWFVILQSGAAIACSLTLLQWRPSIFLPVCEIIWGALTLV